MQTLRSEGDEFRSPKLRREHLVLTKPTFSFRRVRSQIRCYHDRCVKTKRNHRELLRLIGRTPALAQFPVGLRRRKYSRGIVAEKVPNHS